MLPDRSLGDSIFSPLRPHRAASPRASHLQVRVLISCIQGSIFEYTNKQKGASAEAELLEEKEGCSPGMTQHNICLPQGWSIRRSARRPLPLIQFISSRILVKIPHVAPRR